ncbi:MAG: tRNA (guanosine(37)-N1)-methyltransferase TrmD, partial [Parvularculaceae bacterium]|nr:tRNA (guanosine(37)-N1)-methyltransferase TrmD [Parvularculaceae bacterium]
TAVPLTLYPDMFPGPLGHSMAGRALESGTWSCAPVQIRDFATDKHRTVDDTPAGGGAGLVMRADILAAAFDAVPADGRARVYLSPRGARLDQPRVRALASGPGIVALCGRFEGVDARLIEARGIEEISLGDFILAGGEIAAMALVEACVRLLPGVLGSPSSLDEESFETGLLEYPLYTRPRSFEGLEIPSVLLSGDHKKIAAWRRAAAEHITRSRRPDLWKRYCENGPLRSGDKKDDAS